MDVRKLAVVFGLSVSCTGCVTETTSVQMSPENAAKIKNLKEVDLPQRDAKPQTWIAVGEVHESKGDSPGISPAQQSAIREEARKAYQKAAELDPKCVAAHFHLANLYLKQEDSERALAAYQRGVQQNPKSAILWHEYGIVQCRRKDINNALQSLAKALELEPDNRNFATDLGLYLALAGQHREAANVLSRAMNKADANYNVARMMIHINQPETGREYLRLALADRPTHQDASKLLAQMEGPRPGATVVLGESNSGSVNQATFSYPR